MRRTVVENTSGLWERIPHQDIEIVIETKERGYGCFYEVSSVQTKPLWGSTVTEETEFIRSFR